VGYQQGEPTLLAIMRIPLPARGNDEAIEAATHSADAAAARLDAARRRAGRQLEQADALQRAAIAQLQVLDQEREARRTAEQLARRRLEEGGPYLQIWLDVRRERLALERERLDLQLLLLIAGGETMGESNEAAALTSAADEP
jgi:outer membrane protein TolC